MLHGLGGKGEVVVRQSVLLNWVLCLIMSGQIVLPLFYVELNVSFLPAVLTTDCLIFDRPSVLFLKDRLSWLRNLFRKRCNFLLVFSDKVSANFRTIRLT